MLSRLKKIFRTKENTASSRRELPELYPDMKELIALKDRKSNLKINAQKSIKSTIPGDHHSPFRGQGLEFDAVREYVPGDDVRNIDWRVTARIGSPHMKLFKEERERQAILCVDTNASMRFGTRNTFKSIQAARIASILGWHALSEHDRVGACLFGDVPNGIQYFSPQRTRKSMWAMLKVLTEPSHEHHVVELSDALNHIKLAAQTGALIYVISDFLELNDDLERVLSRLNRRCDVVCIAVNDPADAEILPVGTLQLEGTDEERVAVDTESEAGRKDYQLKWKENRRKLTEIVGRAKVSMLQLTTEMDIQKDLVLGLRMIGRRRRR